MKLFPFHYDIPQRSAVDISPLKQFFIIIVVSFVNAGAMERRRAAAVVHFPDENNNAKPETGRPVLLESSPAAWRFQDGQDNQLTRVAGKHEDTPPIANHV